MDNESIRDKAQETSIIIEEAFRGIAGRINSILIESLEQTDDVSKNLIKDIKNSINAFSKITDQIASNSHKINEGLLSSKNIQNQINARKIEQESIESKILMHISMRGRQETNLNKLIKKNGELTAYAKRTLSEEQQKLILHYSDSKKYNDEYIEQLTGQNELVKKQEYNLGSSGNIIKGISKIPVLGNYIEAEKILLEAQKKAAEENSSRGKVMMSIFNNVGKSLVKNLLDPLTLFTALMDSLSYLDKQTEKIAKNFGTSYQEALNINIELNSIANKSNELNINSKSLSESLLEINKSLNTNSLLTSKILKNYTNITKVAGYNNEAILYLNKITIATGGDLENNLSVMLGQAKVYNVINNLSLNEKTITESLLKTSKAIALSLDMHPKSISKAIITAKALGLELSQIENIMSSLLKFESSITSEIEAELLLGKSINLEKARYYALTNDIEGVTREIASHIGTAKDFTDMNVIQQNALAKAVGLSREELASSLIEREALNKLGNKDLNLQEAYNRLKKEGLSQDRIAKELGNEALARQYESQSIQTKFNASIEKLKDIFVGLAGPVLKIVSPFVDLASSILPHIVSLFEPILTITKWLGEAINYVVTGFNNILKSSEHINFGFKIMKETLGAIAFIVGAIYLKEKAVLALETIKKAYKATSLGMQKTSLLLSGRELALSGSMLGKVLALASANIVASFAASPIKTAIGMAAGVAAVATLASLVGRMSKQDDMVSEGYGKRIISSPEGTIALNDRDTIVAGTDLFRQESTSNKNQIINNQININPLIEEMKQIKTLLGNLLNKESNVYIDGFLVGKSLSLSSVKIG